MATPSWAPSRPGDASCTRARPLAALLERHSSRTARPRSPKRKAPIRLKHRVRVSSTPPVGLSVPYRTPDTPPSQITPVSVRAAANSSQGPSARSRNNTTQPGCPALLGSTPRTVASGKARPRTNDRLDWLAGAFHSSAQRPSPGRSWRTATRDDDEDKPPTSSPNAPRPRTGLVCCGTDMATPSLLSSPMLPMWSLTSRSLGWFAARRAGLDAA